MLILQTLQPQVCHSVIMENIREGGRTIRLNTNRREEVSMLQELKDVNNKTLKEIVAKRRQKQQETPDEEEVYKRKMGPQFMPEPPKRERKSHPIFHDDIKTKDFKKDQYLVMPTVPAYSPVDPGPKIVLESRTRKYPYVHKKLTTTEEMKKPRVSTLGVLPVRSSSEIISLNVMMEGARAPVKVDKNAPGLYAIPQEPKLYNTPASSFVVPKLPVSKDRGSDSERIPEGIPKSAKAEIKASKVEELLADSSKTENITRKPAIFAGEGTSLTVKFHERAKPAPKPSFLKDKYKTARGLETASRPSTGASMRSSLMSGDLTLPDEAVYKKYDDAISHMDDGDDVETAVGAANKSMSSRPDSVKSVKELLEEAKRIASPDKRKIAQKPDVEVEEKRGERTVDEIIASLRDQSAYQMETAADRKIKEIMGRVMSRTNANLSLDERDDGGATDEESMAAGTDGGESLLGVPATDLDLKSSPAMTPDASSLKGDSPRVEGVSIASADAFGGSMKDIVAAQEQIIEESEGDGVSVTTKTTETVPGGLDQAEGEEGNESDQSEDYVDLDYQNVGLDYVELEQAWEDLLAPTEATNEDILNVQGEQKDLQGRGLPGPPYPGSKSNVLAPSVSFLATWGPATSRTKKEEAGEIKGKIAKEYSKNIHHFCRMSSEYQLPAELMHAGRKYHTPDRFPSVMPDQPYRFQSGELSPLLESESPSASSSVRMEQAAQRVVVEAHKKQMEERGGGGLAALDMGPTSLLEWQQRAENMLNESEVLEGGRATVRTDESQVYWNPAPPKLGATSNSVRQILFPQYCVEELDEFGRVRVPVPGDEESDSSEEEEEEAISPEDKAAIERTVRRRHNSSETLTAFSREKTLVSMYSKMDGDPSDKASSYVADGAETEDGDIAAALSVVDGEATTSVVIPVADADTVGVGVDGTPAAQGDDEDELAAQIGDSQSVDARPSSKNERAITQQRPFSAPNLVALDDDTLIVPQDFNTAIHEITEQKRLLEKAKRQFRVQEAFDELEQMEKLEQLELKEQKEKQGEEQAVTQETPEEPEDYNILTVRHPPKPTEEELTPAEKALLAGRNYVILPKKKKKKRGRRTMDVAKIEAVEKMLTEMPPNRLKRHGSMPKLNKIVDREMRVSWHVRSYRASIPDLLNFDEYRTRKRMPVSEDEREWVRSIWNKWFDEVFPPTPEVSEDEDEEVEEATHEAVEKKEEKKKKKDPISDILSQDVEEIDPIVDTPENAQIYQILCEEIEKLSGEIEKMYNPSAFHFCRRGALYRKIGQLRKAENDLDRAISMEPGLLDAYWHRHLLYILQDRKSAALEDLNFIMKTNKNHSGAYRSMAEIYKRQGDITMAIINYSSAIKYNPLDHEAYYQRAQLYEQRGDVLLAMEDYTKAMRIMPSRTDAIMKHGMYYFENENWTHAVNDFTELLRVDPLNSTAYLYRGRAYAKMNNWVPAVHDLSSAIHLDPYSWQAFYQRACILRKAHPMRALQDYSVSLLLNDSEENLMSYLHRGILYNALG
ncbi:tetratricopeptide repeat protein 6, partial [Plakobranchus ocellatus]